MFRPLWTASTHTNYFLRRYMPSNILLDLIRTRRGLKWGLPRCSWPFLTFLPRRSACSLWKTEDLCG